MIIYGWMVAASWAVGFALGETPRLRSWLRDRIDNLVDGRRIAAAEDRRLAQPLGWRPPRRVRVHVTTTHRGAR